VRRTEFCAHFCGMQGPILAFVYAVKEMLKEGRSRNGLLPVNVAFVFEGEEENGSAGFREAVQANLHWFEGTQLIIISNTLWVGEEVSHLWLVSPGY
jgi:acetylornithine deacetylase/succinyl-diaminopimelate desuccinylase-like protein